MGASNEESVVLLSQKLGANHQFSEVSAESMGYWGKCVAILNGDHY